MPHGPRPFPSAREAEFRALWADPGISLRWIGHCFGTYDRVLQRWAGELDLPPRVIDPQLVAAGGRLGAALTHRLAEERAAEQVARCDRYLAAERARQQPQRTRCMCGGIVDPRQGIAHQCGCQEGVA